MGLGSKLEHADRFAAYVNELTKVIGHADREGPFRDYCAGLLATEGRRSVEPMAVVTDPGHVSTQHQKLLHVVANSPWSDESTTVDPDMPLRRLVDLAKMRWRVERDYEDLKQEIGLGHYEGRGWRGFHHHGTLAIAAYGFLISEREGIPPSGPHSTAPIEKSPLPSGYRPRGAPDPAAAPHPQLDCHDPSRADRRDCKQTSAMPALRAPHSQ